MNKVAVIPFISSLIVILTLATCATVTQPGGGPRDKKPPQLISSIPVKGQLNFKGKRIELTFDELIQLSDAKNQLIITPRIKGEYEIEYKNNVVTVTLESPLQDSTTYTFNFREAIQDLTERNSAKALSLSFSTGPYIDSSSIEGYVYDLLTESPAKQTLIALYFAGDTLSILNQAPDYMGITLDDGTFKIENLAADNYRIYALNDKNKNSILDYKNEKYGFINDTLNLDTALNDINIPIVFNDLKPMDLTSARPNGKYFIAKFNKYIYDFTVEPDSLLLYKIEPDNKSIRFFNTVGNSTDSIQTIVNLTDSTGYVKNDTFYIKFPESPRDYEEYNTTTTIKPVLIGKYLLEGEIGFNKPSAILTPDSITIFIDSINQIKPDTNIFKWEKKRTVTKFSLDITDYVTDSTNYSKSNITFGEDFFISVDGDSSLASQRRISTVTSDKFGAIEVNVVTDEENYKVQLLDTKLKLIKEVVNTEKINFNYLDPGSYFIRAIIDKNGNGKWDPGDITKNITPEKVKFFKYEDSGEYQIVIRANFIIGPLNFEF